MSTALLAPTAAPCAAVRQPDFARVFVRHPRMYAAFLALSAADVVLTLLVLSLGGKEVNPVAADAIRAFGPAVLPFYKLVTVLVVLTVCESLARLRPRTGRAMARAAVVVMTVPVSYTLVLLAANGPY